MIEINEITEVLNYIGGYLLSFSTWMTRSTVKKNTSAADIRLWLR